MTHALLSARLGSEFDAFLFAPIGDDGNGRSLSVISALARLDLDPWQEAVSLSNLPAIAATQRLTSLIGALPGGLANHFAAAAIATRLAGLLPRFTGAGSAAIIKPNVDDKQKLRSGLLMGGVFILVALGSQWFVSNKRAPEKVDHAPVQTTGAIAPKVPTSY
jgi:hypothetical protein